MTELSQDGRPAVDEIAKRHGVSPEAVEHVLMALMAGQGSQAQFNHPDLGGMGQWSQGGMTMVGDMFNNQLKARVDAICSDVAQLMLQSGSLHVPAGFSSQSQSQGGSYPGNQTQGHSGMASACLCQAANPATGGRKISAIRLPPGRRTRCAMPGFPQAPGLPSIPATAPSTSMIPAIIASAAFRSSKAATSL